MHLDSAGTKLSGEKKNNPVSSSAYLEAEPMSVYSQPIHVNVESSVHKTDKRQRVFSFSPSPNLSSLKQTFVSATSHSKDRGKQVSMRCCCVKLQPNEGFISLTSADE